MSFVASEEFCPIASEKIPLSGLGLETIHLEQKAYFAKTAVVKILKYRGHGVWQTQDLTGRKGLMKRH